MGAFKEAVHWGHECDWHVKAWVVTEAWKRQAGQRNQHEGGCKVGIKRQNGSQVSSVRSLLPGLDGAEEPAWRLAVGVGVSVKRQSREKKKMAKPAQDTRAVHCARCHREPIDEWHPLSVLPFL